MKISRIDHFVLTVKNIQTTVEFYTRVLGMKSVVFGERKERTALIFGEQKINLHQQGNEIQPHALKPASGSADVFFITETSLIDVLLHLRNNNIVIEEGIVTRTGALGPLKSVYFRDPDGNLIEVSNYH